MMGGFALSNETRVALDDPGGRLFNLPLTDVTESFSANRCFLCRLRRCPSSVPIFAELFNEYRPDFSRLDKTS
jgi:hypothetical protein